MAYMNTPAYLCAMTLGALTVAQAAHAGGPIEDPIPEPIPDSDKYVQLVTIAEGFTAPNNAAHAPGDPIDRLFVADQDGIVWDVNLQTGEKRIVLDVSDRLVELGLNGPGTFDVRGMLGMTVHPDFVNNGLMYTFTSEPADGEADFTTLPDDVEPAHQSVIIEWQMPNPTDPQSVFDPDSARELLRVDQPQSNNNGGAMAFGPQGFLYISFGDGGSEDDMGVGHSDVGNGQDPTNILGSIIRIDPQGANAANGQYGIPEDNPFAPTDGPQVNEIFIHGFDNPFRHSFDSETGDFYNATVGSVAVEEINRIEFPFPTQGDSDVLAGGNFGWRCKEGSFFIDPNGDEPAFLTKNPPHDVPSDLIDPIAEFDQDEGLAVIGGHVYNGTKIMGLKERFVFGTLTQTFTAPDGELFFLNKDDEIRRLNLVDADDTGLFVQTFARDNDGELYVLGNLTGTPFESTGMLKMIRTLPGDLNASGAVNIADLIMLLNNWGACPGCPADVDDDGTVGVSDLLILLGNWG